MHSDWPAADDIYPQVTERRLNARQVIQACGFIDGALTCLGQGLLWLVPRPSGEARSKGVGGQQRLDFSVRYMFLAEVTRKLIHAPTFGRRPVCGYAGHLGARQAATGEHSALAYGSIFATERSVVTERDCASVIVVQRAMRCSKLWRRAQANRLQPLY
jgi:hypothetical protein